MNRRNILQDAAVIGGSVIAGATGFSGLIELRNQYSTILTITIVNETEQTENLYVEVIDGSSENTSLETKVITIEPRSQNSIEFRIPVRSTRTVTLFTPYCSQDSRGEIELTHTEQAYAKFSVKNKQWVVRN